MSCQSKIYRTITTPGFIHWHISQQNQSHFSSSEMGPLGSRPVFGKCMVPTALWKVENTVLKLPGGAIYTREHKSHLYILLFTSSISTFPFPSSLSGLPPSPPSFSSFLPFSCWSLVAFPSCSYYAGTHFSFVRPYFPCRAHSWLSLVLLAQECRGDEFGGIVGVKPRASCILSKRYTTKSQHQPQ